MKRVILGLAGLAALGTAFSGALPAKAQSVGYVTGLPGPDPAGHGGIMGWGPAFRPETSFRQPGTPLTPGEIAGRAYRARTGHPVYDSRTGLEWGLSPRYAEPGYAYRGHGYHHGPYLAHRHLAHRHLVHQHLARRY